VTSRATRVSRGSRGIGKVLREAQRQGVVIATTRRGHYKLRCPNGAVITCSVSPSDTNAWKNVAKDLSRYGQVQLDLDR
jgi:hypothetical protein